MPETALPSGGRGSHAAKVGVVLEPACPSRGGGRPVITALASSGDNVLRLATPLIGGGNRMTVAPLSGRRLRMVMAPLSGRRLRMMAGPLSGRGLRMMAGPLSGRRHRAVAAPLNGRRLSTMRRA